MQVNLQANFIHNEAKFYTPIWNRFKAVLSQVVFYLLKLSVPTTLTILKHPEKLCFISEKSTQTIAETSISILLNYFMRRYIKSILIALRNNIEV